MADWIGQLHVSRLIWTVIVHVYSEDTFFSDGVSILLDFACHGLFIGEVKSTLNNLVKLWKCLLFYFFSIFLTHFSPKTPEKVIGKQFSPRSDTAECINYMNFYKT